MRVVAIENMGPESALVIQERGALTCPIGCSRIAVEAFGGNRADLLRAEGDHTGHLFQWNCGYSIGCVGAHIDVFFSHGFDGKGIHL